MESTLNFFYRVDSVTSSDFNGWHHYCQLLKHKIITDKQLLYIYNTVIILRIEYQLQLVFLSKEQCNIIQTPFRTLFKHKLRMPKNTPNAILTNNLIYNFRDLYNVQIQAKYSNLLIQLNDNTIVSDTIHIRLRKLQSIWWLDKNPLISWPFKNKVYNKDHIADLLSSIHEFNLSFNVKKELTNEISGKQIHLTKILTDQIYKNAIDSIKHNKIMFLDQLTSLDDIFLLKWIDTKLSLQW